MAETLRNFESLGSDIAKLLPWLLSVKFGGFRPTFCHPALWHSSNHGIVAWSYGVSLRASDFSFRRQEDSLLDDRALPDRARG